MLEESTEEIIPVEENVLKVNPDDFDYDEKNDIMKPRNAFAYVEKHPSVDKLKRDNKREGKVANLKKKILDTLKVEEKKKRDLSVESVRSGCSDWGNDGAGSVSDREQAGGLQEQDQMMRKVQANPRKVLDHQDPF